MGLGDKMRAKSQEFEGKAKEAMGKAKGDEGMKREGEKDTSKSDMKQAGEKAKDAWKKR